jgi:hypothetical protein
MRWLVIALMACSETSLTTLPSSFEGDGDGECSDGDDNNGDGLVDCEDEGCAGLTDCISYADDTDPAEVIPVEPPVTTDDDPVDPADTIDTDVVDTDVVDTDPPLPPATFGTPGEFDVPVPAGVTSVLVQMWGGGGAGGNQAGATGGGGAFVSARFPVTPGELLTVYVGDGSDYLGDGAGASALLRGPVILAIAGGGGGGGSDGNNGRDFGGGAGGAGGDASGQSGQGLIAFPAYVLAGSDYCTAANGGQGGGPTSGGAGGTFAGTGEYACVGEPGGALTGGASSGAFGACDTGGAAGWRSGGGQYNGGGGGGGSGWFGGGGAGFIWTYCGGGGGGGSSYVNPAATSSVVQPGSGRVQGNAALSGGAGRGGPRAWDPVTMTFAPSLCRGSDGRVELVW